MKNIESYSASDTIKYYEKLSSGGLFGYEKSIVSRYFPLSENVVDIGCGAGRTTVALKEMGYDVIGIDYSSRMIEAANSLSPDVSYEIMDVRNLEFPDASFGCAIFTFNGLMLLETYEDRKKALMEIRRILKDGGIFSSQHRFSIIKSTEDIGRIR